MFIDTYLEKRLKSTRKSICEGMVFAMEKHQSSKSITDRISDAIIANTRHGSTDLVMIKTLLYLTSDILFNSVQSTEAWSYVRHFE